MRGDSEYTDREWADIVKSTVAHYATPNAPRTPAPKKYTLAEIIELLEDEGREQRSAERSDSFHLAADWIREMEGA